MSTQTNLNGQLRLTAKPASVVTVAWMQYAVDQIFAEVAAAQEEDDEEEFEMDYFSLLNQVQTRSMTMPA